MTDPHGYRADAADSRQDRSDNRQDVAERHSRATAREVDALNTQVAENMQRMDTADNRSDKSEKLARLHHAADMTQRVIVVAAIIVVITIIVLQSVLLVHVLNLETENKRLNLQLISQQELLAKTAESITAATLAAIACAEPRGPESPDAIQACVDARLAG